jgi:hypothetical protein
MTNTAPKKMKVYPDMRLTEGWLVGVRANQGTALGTILGWEIYNKKIVYLKYFGHSTATMGLQTSAQPSQPDRPRIRG